ncbi:hypothetical protein Ga0466249_004369 [Sporomusaceae bacterium BoRhaA]|uniref:DUF7916 family protein n=1 Tax=Pelorhabdus rhamnosifermentans TaxID=2772457 RepID=UPI001C0606E8|nr:haloacid dehalogenase-like hydrolase [Pelorhabdus rhamnosifermentans]MBU2703229.1 hypothetical protein [Pelorhabdus rhamnosifermentans]
MIERILDLHPNELIKLKGINLLSSIRAAAGRTMVCEVICPVMPLLYDVTNAELAASMGADIILLNLYDVLSPAVFGVTPAAGESVIQALQRLAGRVIGINLEPFDSSCISQADFPVTEGRRATRKNARLAYEQGVQLITVTGNPKTGVSNASICQAIAEIKDELGDEVAIIAGKMHAAGVEGEMSESILTEKVAADFLAAGADVILVPAPGTVPGITVEKVTRISELAHKRKALIMTTVGTSQEGADRHTISTIALQSVMAGADIHHMGDSGYVGISIPENILTYSMAIRGRRHTFKRMAMRI